MGRLGQIQVDPSQSSPLEPRPEEPQEIEVTSDSNQGDSDQ